MSRIPRKYCWHLLEVDGCQVYRIHGISELLRIRISAHKWAQHNGWTIHCWQIPGILFVVREPDGSGTVAASTREVPCQAVQSETKCKQWRLRVPTVPRLGRRRTLTLTTAPRWGPRLLRSRRQPWGKPDSTASR